MTSFVRVCSLESGETKAKPVTEEPNQTHSQRKHQLQSLTLQVGWLDLRDTTINTITHDNYLYLVGEVIQLLLMATRPEIIIKLYHKV